MNTAGAKTSSLESNLYLGFIRIKVVLILSGFLSLHPFSRDVEQAVDAAREGQSISLPKDWT